MLLLDRKEGESFVLLTSDGEIVVTVIERRRTRYGPRFRLGISAPESVRVVRRELLDAAR